MWKNFKSKKWWLFFYVVITSDYVFTDQYLLFKIKMDASVMASVHLQFNQSTNQWLARSLTTNQKPCPVQNPGAKGSSCRLIFAELLVRAAAGYLVNNYNCDFFLSILAFSNQKIYIILMPRATTRQFLNNIKNFFKFCRVTKVTIPRFWDVQFEYKSKTTRKRWEHQRKRKQ